MTTTATTGATGTTYAIAKVAGSDAGAYTVVVANASGAVTSAVATLAVNTAPAITVQPQNVTAKAGDNVTLSVTATGSPAPSYQWSRNGAAIAGATSATLSLSNVTLANTGVYTVAT